MTVRQDLHLLSVYLMHCAGSALPRVHSALAVLAARELLPGLANVVGAELLESVTTPAEAVLCNLFCLCRRAQLEPSAVAACPPVLMTFLLAFHRCVSARSVIISETSYFIVQQMLIAEYTPERCHSEPDLSLR